MNLKKNNTENKIDFRPNAIPDSPSRLNKIEQQQRFDYTSTMNREKSFQDYPIILRQKYRELSNAGFYYIGVEDQVRCFRCGGGLKDWKENDIPWEQHALYYDKCDFLNVVKGKKFIKNVKNKYLCN